MRTAAAAAALLLAAACTTTEVGTSTSVEEPGSSTTTPSTTVTTSSPTTTVTSSPTTAPEGSLPAEPAVAVDAGGRLVVIDLDTGAVARVLAEGLDTSDPADLGVAVTPDWETVYAVHPGEEGVTGYRLLAHPIDGGEPTLVAEAAVSPAVDASGSRLAYVAFRPGDGHPTPEVVVRRLDSGAETTIGGGDGFVFVSDLAWAPGGEALAFIAGEVRTSAWRLPLDAGSLAAATRLGPGDAAEEGTDWIDVAAGPEHLVVSQRCCDLPAEHHSISRVDPATGEVVGVAVPRRSQPLDAATSLVAGPGDGEILAVVGVRPDTGGTLVEWSDSPPPDQVAEGIMAVDR